MFQTFRRGNGCHAEAPSGDWTHDRTLTKRTLCQLSYRGIDLKEIQIPMYKGESHVVTRGGRAGKHEGQWKSVYDTQDIKMKIEIFQARYLLLKIRWS